MNPLEDNLRVIFMGNCLCIRILIVFIMELCIDFNIREIERKEDYDANK